MTEDQIERRVERMTDNIDRRFMAGQLSQKAYDAEMADLRRWADAQRPTDVSKVEFFAYGRPENA